MKHIGDMADQAAQALQQEHEKEIAQRPVPFEEDPHLMERKGVGVFSKLEFKWRESDYMILQQIRAASERAFMEMYDGTIDILDDLYAQIRVAELTAHDTVKRDDNNRPVWEREEDGSYKEDWSRLDGVDIERSLFELTKIRLAVGTQVGELLMEAMFAKHIHTEEHDDAYVGAIDGTVADRTARANRKARESKYHSFYRYWLWHQSKVFLDELNNFQRVLERVRDWGVRSQYK